MTHPLVLRLRDPSPDVRADACAEVADDPSAVLLVDPLADALGDPVRGVQRAASDALARLAGRDAAVRALLQQRLRARERRTRWGALETLARLGTPQPGWLPVLVEGLDDERGEVRWTAARQLVDLARIEPQAAAVVAGLARSDERPGVRRMALFCLARLEPEAPQTRSLLEALATGDPDPRVRRAARLALEARARAS